MIYGNSIGKKFHEDGSVRYFPGNTVVAPIAPGCSAYDAMVQLRQMVVDAGLDSHLILLPEDSYHMTVLDGVVFEKREPGYWPEELPLDASMEQTDAYVSAAVATAPNPGSVRMKFDQLVLGKNCAVARLLPADQQQEEKLWAFRDQAAAAMQHYLPNHTTYRFHISLGYLRIQPEGEDALRMEEVLKKANEFLAAQPPFWTGVPYMAYFEDMLAFSPTPLPR